MSALAVACAGGRRREAGRLLARPSAPSGPLRSGLQPMGLAASRDAFLFVPSPAATKLIVACHGAGGSGERFIARVRPYAEAIGAIVLAPSSRGPTWDAIGGEFGRDVALIDRALDAVFQRAAVDPGHVAIAGFSDGASYALSLGLVNGDLFSHVLAFSPGFLLSDVQRGKPRLFVSHGDADEILPIERCGRPIAARLERAGYDVLYREFDGGHSVPGRIVADAMAWFAGP